MLLDGLAAGATAAVGAGASFDMPFYVGVAGYQGYVVEIMQLG